MNPERPSILVVDDDVDTCHNLSDILGDLGYHVDMAHDALSALELIRKTPYDVALMDLKMPGMDGLTLYREIKKMRSGTVGIIVTAYSGGIGDEAAAAGVWQVLPKPIDPGRILGLVEEALGQPLVIVVDDDHDLCSNLWDLLRERGYRVCLAHSESEAADRLTDRGYRVVLIDIKLPDGDGSTLFEKVRISAPDARTILITGFRSEVDQLVDQLLAEGANAVCYKPFDVEDLLGTLERLARRNATTDVD